MVSVTSASRYQRRPSMYIQGLIPRNWPRQFRLAHKLWYLSRKVTLLKNACVAKGYLVGPQAFIGITSLCLRAVKALARLSVRAGSSKPSQCVYAKFQKKKKQL